MASASRPTASNARVAKSIESTFIQRGLRDHDGPLADCNTFPAGGPELPPDEPDSAAADNAADRLVQPDRAAPRTRRLDSDLALLLRPRPERGQGDAIPQHA